MTSIKRKLRNLLHRITNSRLKDIPVSVIKSEITEISLREGWGGKHIKYFPPYHFFRTYLSGEKLKSKHDMEQWYYNRFINEKLYKVPNNCGGMFKGSLFTTITKLHKSKGIDLEADLSNSRESLIIQGIKEKTKERFELIDSIIANGYCGNEGSIYLRKSGDCYILIDGHHRVATMAAMGHVVTPCTTKNNTLLCMIKKFLE